MSVMVCPKCGAEYVATVAVCADDGTLLIESDVEEMEATIADEVAHADDLDAADLEGEELEGSPSGEQTAYDLADWDVESRILLGRLLTGEDVVHVWEASTLVVRAEDEEQVDDLIEQVETSNQPLLDPDKDQAVYELEDWSDEKREALVESLAAVDIPFGFDENDDLVVHEEDEDRIDAILDQVDLNFSLDGDAIAEGDDDGDDLVDDGLAAQEALSDLFLAADRLMHDAKDRGGVTGMVDAAKAVAGFALPYGFAPGVWAHILSESKALSEMLTGDAPADDDVEVEVDDAAPDDVESDQVESDDEAAEEAAGQAGPADDETIEAAARQLRELLRQYV